MAGTFGWQRPRQAEEACRSNHLTITHRVNLSMTIYKWFRCCEIAGMDRKQCLGKTVEKSAPFENSQRMRQPASEKQPPPFLQKAQKEGHPETSLRIERRPPAATLFPSSPLHGHNPGRRRQQTCLATCERARDRVDVKKDRSVIGDTSTSRISIEESTQFKGGIEIDPTESQTAAGRTCIRFSRQGECDYRVRLRSAVRIAAPKRL